MGLWKEHNRILLQLPAIKRLLVKLTNIFLPRRWIIDNFWIRIFFIRPAVLSFALYCNNILRKERFYEKNSAISDFIRSVVEDLKFRRCFKGTAGTSEGSEYPGEAAVQKTKQSVPFFDMREAAPGSRFINFFVPSRHFHDSLINYILSFDLKKEERYFKLEDLAAVERGLAAHGKKSGHTARVFIREQRDKFSNFFGDEKSAEAMPESYLVHFFPAFIPIEFVKNMAPFTIGHEKLFQAREAVDIANFLNKRLRMRNPRNLLQRMIPAFKKLIVSAVFAFYASLFLFDLGMIIYGIPKNEYYFSFPNIGRIIETFDTPYAHRANRIFRRNQEARFADFRYSKGGPPGWNSYRINNDAQVAVELNYDSYKSLRVQDQNGLMVVSLNRNKIKDLAKTDINRYRRLMDLMIDKRWWEKVIAVIDKEANHSLNLFDYRDIPVERLYESVTGKIMSSPAPLTLVNGVNEICDCLTVLYYKANSMKWADISEIPLVMIRAVILREDRRFKNNFFPIPHRGNDNMVIIPQITKKLIRSALEYAHDAATRHSIAWLENLCVYSKQQFRAYFSDEGRGGSTISNQVMEMLYTKSITTVSDRKSFNDRQIHQKEHELPASLTVDWFWTEDNIIEAYVNEIYGGHLYSDIRGFKSQAEMYFMRDLSSLNLREQIMLVAAVKKPSRIKEYAMWIKAGELKSLMNKKETRPDAIIEWEKENATYRVERGNVADILINKEKAKSWIENRINSILKLLYVEGEISKDEYLDARDRQNISFKFAPGIYSLANRLVNNIKREIDRGLGYERSDSGLAIVTTIDMDMQGKLQDRIDRESRRIYVDSEFRLAGQPDEVFLEGGARIIRANDMALSVEPKIINKILADAGGTSSEEDEWDWVTLANRSLGSSLKPILDLYFILMGYNLQDELKNSKVTYKTYSLEQQRIYKNYIHKFPKRLQEIENIEKYWSWSPKNFTEHTDRWVCVEDALVRSINSVHVQIQEIVTPAVFAELLNEMMNISEKEGKHQPYRSLILGGSQGDQRYDKFLQAYSIFPNRGILKKQTYLEAVRLPDGRFMVPDYKPLRSDLLERYGKERVAAACLLMNFVLRDIVKRGTMHAMAGFGAGKTGTSNEFRDALATVHFISGTSTYIAGVRLGNRNNYSIGESADTLAVPLLRSIVAGLFDRSLLMKGDNFDSFLKSLAEQSGEIMNAKGQYWLKGRSYRPRRLDVYEIQEEKRKEYLTFADKKFAQEQYAEAAVYYESFLNFATKFDSNNPAFRNMILCYIETGNLKRAGQLIERFAVPGKITAIARAFERNHNVRIKVDEDFYSGDEKYERKKRKKKIRNM